MKYHHKKAEDLVRGDVAIFLTKDKIVKSVDDDPETSYTWKRVHFEDGTSVRCTPNFQWRLAGR